MYFNVFSRKANTVKIYSYVIYVLLESAKTVLGNTRVVTKGVDGGVDDNKRMKMLCLLYKM